LNDKNDGFDFDANLPLDIIDNPVFFKALEKIKIKHFIPLINKSQSKLMLAFGEKAGDDNYQLTQKEKMILKVLKNAAIISLDNANLIGELDQKNIELSKNLGLVSDLYAQIQTSFEELKKIDKIKSDFLNLISHELLTPLTSIKAYTETMMSGDIDIEPEEQKQFLEIINGETIKIEYLVNNMLLMVNLESGAYNYDYKKSSLKDIVTDAVQEAVEKNKDKPAQINVNIDDITIDVDYQSIKIAIKNVVDNAIRNSSAPVVNIDSAIETNAVTINVCDNGKGINASEEEHLFDKFHVNRDINYHQEGLGLGLPMALIILKKGHSGEISYEKNKNAKGITFKLKIPISRINDLNDF